MKAQAVTYTLNEPDVVAEDFDGKIVILNLADGRYFSLEGIGGRIWSLLLDGLAPEAVLESIECMRPELRDSSSQFIGRLIEWRLIRPTEAGNAVTGNPIDEAWAADEPRIEAFDDLAELIFADPIHDVDEQAGWPSPRPAQ
jgi:hypothetical protein